MMVTNYSSVHSWTGWAACGLQDHAVLLQASAFTADVLVAPPGPSAMRLAPFSAAAAQRAVAGAAGYRWVDSSLGGLSVAASYAGRTGVCGNGFCEARPLFLESTL